ncbi:HlyD family secretion protein [Microbacter margulisiae]|uniref:Membrane fusion protein (Multidrug efflux system) n=1 Tax=Microbacter margulisiae TaxID=1350067 RepID=A0A7W5DPR0_9PORP|nr:HlyD family secretion protein [Microbacter margulisiae]MBB3186822.1 membrane fusion protein (multidrug efflux system) [Microbacter margulisiae]
MKIKKITKQNLKIYLPVTIIILLVITAGIYWYEDYAHYLQTDDAYVDSDNLSITPKVVERIDHLFVDEGDTVKQGELLATLDSADLIAQRQQVLSSILQTKAAEAQAQANYQLNTDNSKIAYINWQRSLDDFTRAKTQFAGGVIPKEQYDHFQKTEEAAKAQVSASQAMIQVSKTQINSAEAAIKTAEAQLGVINTQLANTKLYAPCDGIISKRWQLPGDLAQMGQAVFTLNNTNKFWVLVNLEETKMEHLSIGQKALFTLDTYPGVTFTGKVFYIGASTASQFSLIPPNNASGNFTKVTQRVPVKVSIDGTENGTPLSQYVLRTGMSVVIKIVKK